MAKGKLITGIILFVVGVILLIIGLVYTFNMLSIPTWTEAQIYTFITGVVLAPVGLVLLIIGLVLFIKGRKA